MDKVEEIRKKKFLQSLGIKLRRLRDSVNICKEQFEKRHEFTAATIGTWERGQRDPGIDRLMSYLKLYEHYGINIDLPTFLGRSHNTYKIIDGETIIDDSKDYITNSTFIINCLRRTPDLIFYINAKQQLIFINENFIHLLQSNYNHKILVGPEPISLAMVPEISLIIEEALLDVVKGIEVECILPGYDNPTIMRITPDYSNQFDTVVGFVALLGKPKKAKK